jgi:hypothetical protein
MEEATIVVLTLVSIVSTAMWAWRENQLANSECERLKLHMENSRLSATIARIDKIDQFNSSTKAQNAKYLMKFNGLTVIK